MPKCQNVKICGIVKIDDSAITALLAQILAAIEGGVTVNPSDAWEAIFLNALNAAEISLDAATLEALEEITVTVNTSGGPVEITGTVGLDLDGALDVNITNTPLDVNITNWDQLLSSTLNVSLNGETVNVQFSEDQLAALIADDDTDDDVRPVAIHCFNWTSGETSGTFIGWANAAEDGSFAGYTTVSGTPPPDGANVTCDTMSVTNIVAIKLEPKCAQGADGPTWVYPISMLDTGTGQVTNIVYLGEDGKPVEVKGLIDDCDCAQPKCCEDETSPCPTLTVSDVQNTDTGDTLAFPFTAEGRLFPFDFSAKLDEQEGCLAANPDAEITIRITQDHEALPYSGHRGYIFTTSAGTFTAESATNTFETAGAVGNANIGIGYAQADPASATRAIRWVEATMTVADLFAGVAFTGIGFGGVGGASETIYSQTVEIVGGLEGICDGC